MRRIGWALIGVTALMVGGLQAAEAAATCKLVPSMCPVEAEVHRGSHKPTEVPEPGTLILLGAGISALSAAALRRRKSNKEKE